MFVSTKNAATFAALEEGFGVPEVKNDVPELFGWYHSSETPGFWLYDPDTKEWTGVEFGNLDQLPFVDGSMSWDEDYRKAVESVRMSHEPTLPADRTTLQRGKPFLHLGFMFQWLFIPELNRWEILPLGRFEKRADEETNAEPGLA